MQATSMLLVVFGSHWLVMLYIKSNKFPAGFESSHRRIYCKTKGFFECEPNDSLQSALVWAHVLCLRIWVFWMCTSRLGNLQSIVVCSIRSLLRWLGTHSTSLGPKSEPTRREQVVKRVPSITGTWFANAAWSFYQPIKLIVTVRRATDLANINLLGISLTAQIHVQVSTKLLCKRSDVCGISSTVNDPCFIFAVLV